MTGTDVRQLRVRLGLTQAQLARLLARDVGTISGWERGRRIPATADDALAALVTAANLAEARR